jgi:hypothetical protein
VDRSAVALLVLGTLIAVVPLAVFPFPGGGGPVTFVVRAGQTVFVIVGCVIVWIGLRR